VLDKPGKLTPEEWALMRRHPAYTAEVLARVECLRTVAGTAASHHERALAILDADAGTRLDRRSIAALHRLLDGVAVDLAA
jgi:hypothetical protein